MHFLLVLAEPDVIDVLYYPGYGNVSFKMFDIHRPFCIICKLKDYGILLSIQVLLLTTK